MRGVLELTCLKSVIKRTAMGTATWLFGKRIIGSIVPQVWYFKNQDQPKILFLKKKKKSTKSRVGTPH